MTVSSLATKTVSKLKLSLTLALLGFGTLAGRVLAAEDPTLKNLKGAADAGGFSTRGDTPDLAKTAGNIIGYALGLLGVVFVILTIYAGYLWMTAQGNEEQITKAKKMITNAVIGFIIISLAYVITSFVVTSVGEGIKATE